MTPQRFDPQGHTLDTPRLRRRLAVGEATLTMAMHAYPCMHTRDLRTVATLARALQASRPISTGEEVLYAYGEGWWLSRGGNEGAHEGQHEGAGRSSIRTVGAAMPPRAEGDRLRRALKPRPAKGASKAGAKAKPRKKGAPRAQPKKGAAKPKGFGAPAC